MTYISQDGLDNTIIMNNIQKIPVVYSNKDSFLEFTVYPWQVWAALLRVVCSGTQAGARLAVAAKQKERKNTAGS